MLGKQTEWAKTKEENEKLKEIARSQYQNNLFLQRQLQNNQSQNSMGPGMFGGHNHGMWETPWKLYE